MKITYINENLESCLKDCLKDKAYLNDQVAKDFKQVNDALSEVEDYIPDDYFDNEFTYLFKAIAAAFDTLEEYKESRVHNLMSGKEVISQSLANSIRISTAKGAFISDLVKKLFNKEEFDKFHNATSDANGDKNTESKPAEVNNKGIDPDNSKEAFKQFLMYLTTMAEGYIKDNSYQGDLRKAYVTAGSSNAIGGVFKNKDNLDKFDKFKAELLNFCDVWAGKH